MKNKKPARPFVDARSDFFVSLEAYTNEVLQLENAVRMFLRIEKGINDTTRKILEERLAALSTASINSEAA